MNARRVLLKQIAYTHSGFQKTITKNGYAQNAHTRGILPKKQRTTDMNTYTVWVGGIADVERVDFETATEILEEWRGKGYDDVLVEEHEEDN